MKYDIHARRESRHVSRRGLLKGLGAGAAGMLLNPFGHIIPDATAQHMTGKSRVSFITGADRRDMVYQAMKPFEKEIKRGIAGKKVVIKPNFVVNNVPLCATHPDAVRGVLDFLKPIYNQPVIIAESTLTKTGTFEGYKNYGYTNLPNEYGAKLVDLAEAPYTRHWILDENRHPLGINITDTYTDPDNYLISVTRLKTHDTVVATLTLKNIVMGAPVCNNKNSDNQKRFMHSGQPVGLNYNMFLISQVTHPDFAILDGVEGMQGNGPVGGFAMEHGVALAGTDFISVDRVGVELMGITYTDVGYLQWCANAGMGQDDMSKIDILGPDPKQYVKKYQLHENIEWQLEWKES